MTHPLKGQIRPLIEQVRPEINGGRYSIKRCKGDTLQVDATILVDGHDELVCELMYKRDDSKSNWTITPMKLIVPGRDLWSASFNCAELGEYIYTVRAWVDGFQTWRHQFEKRHEAKQDLNVYFKVGANLVRHSLKLWNKSLTATEKKRFNAFIQSLENFDAKVALGSDLNAIMTKYPDRTLAEIYKNENRVIVDPVKARYAAWYEFFPRSFGGLKASEPMIDYVKSMGFDTIYLPPIHPVGIQFRKGKNNSLTPSPTDPGSPWGIGGKAGGHKAINPELGTLADFKRFVKKANLSGIDIAIDIAFQCSPDHPYVKQHPEWFKKLPDGTIQYAENPPKKYQDIYPFDFETKAWKPLWNELKSVIEFWCKQGIRTFRVDNPHTKSFAFWEWAIREIRSTYPDAIFLAEAFTRPAVMYNLGKLGFSQSYTYFTWRNTPAEFQKYLTELTQTEVAEYYRPHFWPNTPDILPFHLQKGERSTFMTRVALAATMSSTYGLYGPAYELLEHKPFKEGGEEYLDSEKYECKKWNLKDPQSIKEFITELNEIRRTHASLHTNSHIVFHETGNDNVLCFSKHALANGGAVADTVLVVANLDYEKEQLARIHLKPGCVGATQESFSFVATPLLKFQNKDKEGVQNYKQDGLRLKLHPKTSAIRIYHLKAAKVSK